MLTIVINPGGTRHIVTIAEAPYLLGHDIPRPNQSPERTPEERRRHDLEMSRERRRRMCERKREVEQ